MEAKTSARKINWAKRRKQAIDMRIAGNSYEEIGACLGINKSSAYRIVKRELDKSNQANKRSIEQMRDIDLMRCDMLQKALWQQAAELADIPSILAVLKIMDRRAKLAGLDTPTQKLVAAYVGSTNPYDGITDAEAAKVLAEIFAEAEVAKESNKMN